MYKAFQKFNTQLNGHVLHRPYALEALRADLIGQELAHHHAYSPLLLDQQMREDYKKCYLELMVAALGNLLFGAFLVLAFSNGYVRSFGAFTAVIGVHLLTQLIQTKPT